MGLKNFEAFQIAFRQKIGGFVSYMKNSITEIASMIALEYPDYEKMQPVEEQLMRIFAEKLFEDEQETLALYLAKKVTKEDVSRRKKAQKRVAYYWDLILKGAYDFVSFTAFCYSFHYVAFVLPSFLYRSALI